MSPYYDYFFAEYDYSLVDKKKFGNKELPWFERYFDVLPLKNHHFLTLGEGSTPLVPSKRFKNCYIKDEGRNPSGCFKDREHAVLFAGLSKKRKYILASSGNAALSASLYGQIYGVEVVSLIPRRTSESKKNLIRLYGGQVVEAGDDYEACHRAILDNEEYRSFTNISAGIHPLKEQGDKVIAFELFEQMAGIPDVILIPSANGCLLSGIYRGFVELQKIFHIEHLPRLIAVQINNAAPLEKALKENRQDFYVLKDADLNSKAEGIVALESFCSPKALHALRETNGFVCTVTEKELFDGMQFAIQKEGVLPEWTSASAFAAFLKLKTKKIIHANEKVVILNTGSGLKQINRIVEELCS